MGDERRQKGRAGIAPPRPSEILSPQLPIENIVSQHRRATILLV